MNLTCNHSIVNFSIVCAAEEYAIHLAAVHLSAAGAANDDDDGKNVTVPGPSIQKPLQADDNAIFNFLKECRVMMVMTC